MENKRKHKNIFTGKIEETAYYARKKPLVVSGRKPYAEKKRLGRFLPRYASCKAVVGKFLKENQRTRGSDKLLIRKVDSFCRSNNIRLFSHETITRARRNFNGEGLYLPSAKTIAVRRNKEKAFREASREGLL